MATLSSCESARTAFYSRRSDREARLYDAYTSERAYREALRLYGSGDPRAVSAQSAWQKALAALQDVRIAESSAHGTLASERSAYLGVDASLDATKLDPAFPLLLFPVRLETKFVTAPDRLLVRIYPDEINADAHEPALTEEEERAGVAYWGAATANSGDERPGWKEIVAQFGAPRAAWIVRSTAGGASSTGYRSHSWTRAPEARVLPDRFVVRAFTGGAVAVQVAGNLIDEPLALAMTPDRGAGLEEIAPGLPVDSASFWTLEFTRALDAGMAVSIPLTPAQAASGFDRVVALGVKASMGEVQSGKALADLVDAQHFTSGFAFVRQGSPTNNTAQGPAAFGARDDGARRSFAIERVPQTVASGTDGQIFSSFLGFTSSVLPNIDRAAQLEQSSAAAMNEALWPATVGYFLEQMMNGAFTGAPINIGPTAVDDARAFYRQWVRGRGPLPVFRVGRVPYGALPVSSLARWAPKTGAGPTETNLPDLLRRVRNSWLDGTSSVPRFNRTGDPDRDLLETLGLTAATREFRARHAFGADFIWNLLAYVGQKGRDYFDAHDRFGQPVLNQIDHPTWLTRVAGLTFDDNADRIILSLIEAAALSEHEGLSIFDYIEWIRTASVTDLRDSTFPAGVTPPTALLYQLLRHAALLEYGRTALQLCITEGVATEAQRMEPELVELTDRSIATDTIWQRMKRALKVSGQRSLETWLSMSKPQPATLATYDGALRTLRELTTAELERLLTETLDVCSHRLDAWITALPTQRIADMRVTKPSGVLFGAFGWAEDVRPATGITTTTLSDGRVVRAYADPAGDTPDDHRVGGYIHAPTADHATAAAILRNAYVSRRGEAQGRFAIDLSSRRVRSALELLEEVRNGEHLGAVLGYRLERALHDQGITGDSQIDAIRAQFPLVAGKAESTMEPAEKVAARNVVDALALVRARDGGTFVPDTPEMTNAVAAVDELIDATADLLTAESVYQGVRGNTGAASASFDALSRGGRPPDPEIAKTRRSGATVTHRVALVLKDTTSSDWSAVPTTPRASVEPWLNAWIGDALGSPASIRCRATYKDATDTSVSLEIGLDALGAGTTAYPLQAYDAMVLLGGEKDARPGSELERRVLAVVYQNDADAKEIQIRYDRDTAWDPKIIRSFDDLSELARSLFRLVASARLLRIEDLMRPEDPNRAVHATPVWSTDTVTRVAAARTELSDSLAELDNATAASPPSASALREALRRVSRFGIAGSFPLSVVPTGTAEEVLIAQLLEQVASVRAEVEDRVAAADEAAGPDAKAKALFGRDFVLLGSVRLADPSELQRALALGATTSGTPSDKRAWMQQAARVRDGMKRLRSVALLSGAMSGTSIDFTVAQLPAQDGARWAALPFAPGENRPRRTVAIEVHAPAGLTAVDLAGDLRGLLIDEWTERIPASEEQTSIAFHYDDPGAEAPQTVLVAAPPVMGAEWSTDALFDVITETLDLAKIRCVDTDLREGFGQFLPAVYLSGNFSGDTVSLNLANASLLADALYPERET